MLALARGRDQRIVHVDRRPAEEGCGLPRPNIQPRVGGGLQQMADVAFGEAAAEVGSGRGIGDPFGVEGVEENRVGAAQFDVLQPNRAWVSCLATLIRGILIGTAA